MLTHVQKTERISRLSEGLSRARATFLVDFKGMNVEQMTDLRKKLHQVGGEIKVVRNTLARLALKDHPETHQALGKEFTGTNAFVFAYEDVGASARTLSDFIKDFEQLKLKTGEMDGQKLDGKKIKYLATLPSKEELQSQMLRVFLGPATHLVRAMNGVPGALLNVLNAYKGTKSE